MNQQERGQLDRLISGMGEVKAELVMLTLHVERQNGSVSKHFADDLAWQQAYEKREAESKGFRRGLLLPLGVIISGSSIASPFIVKALIKLIWGGDV